MLNLKSKIPAVLLLASLALVQSACNDDDVEPEYVGNWYHKALPDFEGISRRSAVSFTANGKGYIGTGYSNENERMKDFWEYTPSSKYWTQVAPFGGSARQDAVAFSIGDKGYVGTGYDGNYKQDLWQYDPASNSWKEVAPLPNENSGRQFATAFVLDNKGYIGLGYDGNYKQDFYEFTPDGALGSWKPVAGFTGGKRRGASAFVVNGRAFVGFGHSNSNVYNEDLYEFLPGQGERGDWVAKAELEDYPRAFAIAVSLNDKGYIIGGSTGSSSRADVWEYDAVADTWTQKTSFEGGSRSYSTGFVADGVIYYGTGQGGGFLDDFWGFNPSDAKVDDD